MLLHSDGADALNAIALYARETPGHAERVDHSTDLLRQAALAHPGRVVQATSLGAEDMVVTDLIAKAQLKIAIGTLQTGKLHDETLALMDRLEAHWGVPLERYAPDPTTVVAFVDRHGELPMFESIDLRRACCGIRKLEPLGRMLDGRSAWITGLRREQSANRADVPETEVDDHGRTKYNVLADWSWADVWHYISAHGVPYNPLHDHFMPSIGCAPCTRAIAVGEDFRAGRWWWEDELAKECGLHVHDDTAIPQEPAMSLIGDRA